MTTDEPTPMDSASQGAAPPTAMPGDEGTDFDAVMNRWLASAEAGAEDDNAAGQGSAPEKAAMPPDSHAENGGAENDGAENDRTGSEDAGAAPKEDAAGDNEGEDAIVTLPDGTEVPMAEIAQSWNQRAELESLRSGVSREHEELDGARAQLRENAAHVQSLFERLNSYVVAMVPPEPEAALMQTDPARYNQMMAMRTQTLAELSQMLQDGEAMAATQEAIDSDADRRIKAQERARLLEKLPVLSDPKRMEAFQKGSRHFLKEAGFEEAEIDATRDARIDRVVYLAMIGQNALRARSGGKRPAAPPPRKMQAGMPARGAPANARAAQWERFNQTRSLEDGASLL